MYIDCESAIITLPVVAKMSERLIHFCVNIVWLCCWTHLGEAGQIQNDAVQVYQKTPLTKCCKDGEFFRPGLDRCLYRTHIPTPGAKIPVLYAVEKEETFLVDVDEFHLSFKLAARRIGKMATSTMEFQVFMDGSLKVTDALILPPGTVGLRCFPPMSEIPKSLVKASAVYPYLLFLSVLFLSSTLTVYILIPQLRDPTGIITMSYISSMAVYYMGLGIIQLFPEMPKIICSSLPVVVHFARLATFAWLNVLCFDLWWDIRKSLNAGEDQSQQSQLSGDSKSRRLVFYCFYGWGVPFSINIVGQVLENVQFLPDHIITYKFAQSQCWFLIENRSPLFAYLYGPVTIMLLGNAIVVILIVFALCKITRYGNEASTIVLPNLTGVRVSMGLFLLMVALWMTDSISLLTDQPLLGTNLGDCGHCQHFNGTHHLCHLRLQETSLAGAEEKVPSLLLSGSTPSTGANFPKTAHL